jgi:hypothetical protein
MSTPAAEWLFAMHLAQEVIEDNFSIVKKAEMWLVGSAVMQDRVTMNFKFTFSDDGTEKLTKDIPKEVWETMKTPWDAVRYMLLYVAQHFVISQFDAKKP